MASAAEKWTEEWYYKVAKGKVQSYVVHEREPLDRVSKTLQTFLGKRHIFPKEVERIFTEVENESVENPSFKKQPYYSDRRQRLDQLRERFIAKKGEIVPGETNVNE